MFRLRNLMFLALLPALILTGCKKKVDAPVAAPVSSGMTDIQPREPVPTPGEMVTEDIYEQLASQLRPVFFDYDRYDLRDDQISTIQANAKILSQHPDARLIIEGHCDERGTEEYNMALGERRAEMVRKYLADSGIATNRLNIISYGESKPFALGHGEESWKENRRAQSVPVRN